MNAKTMKYKDLSQYSAVIGQVQVAGLNLQLCDYVERVEGKWYATAYFLDSPSVQDGWDKSGIYLKTLKAAKDTRLAFVPGDLLSKAVPSYNDEGQTLDLIGRLEKELAKLNTQKIEAIRA
ncbi:MAG: hypothetical protein K9G62_01500 [Alphaproteobacteria bacterium]|nr:hypothetical protein [Alphaproteobacteria bacterium]